MKKTTLDLIKEYRKLKQVRNDYHDEEYLEKLQKLYHRLLEQFEDDNSILSVKEKKEFKELILKLRIS